MNLTKGLKLSNLKQKRQSNLKDMDTTSLSTATVRSSSSSGSLYSLSSQKTSSTLDFIASYRKNCSAAEQFQCLEKLNHYCQQRHRFISGEVLMRYAVYYNFNFAKTKSAIDRGYTYSYHYLELEAELLRFILRDKVFFPLPGLKSRKTGAEVFYFRPSRYLPSTENNGLLLDNLCYILNDMSRTVEQCRNGVVMVVNMDGYSMKNFHGETQMKMTRITEGHVIPTRIVEVLIVNPPKFFARLWKAIKPAFSSSFKRRIRVLSDEKLGNYLMDGYEKFFPDEFLSGCVKTEEIVDDFIDQKLYEEEQRGLHD